MKADVTDSAGNPAFDTESATLDTIIAAEIDILNIAADHKISADESNADVTVVGYVNKDAQPNDKIDFYVNGELIGSGFVSNEPHLDAHGNQIGYKFEFVTKGSNLIPDGEVDGGAILTAKVTVSDVAGNTFVATTTEPYFFDIDAPDAPTITKVTDDSSESDYSVVTLHGTGSEPGNKIEVYADANGEYVSIGTATVQQDLSWTLDISSESAIPLNDNELLYAKETDSFGNVSEPSNVVHYYHGNYNPALSEATDDFVLLGKGNDLLIVDQDDANNMLVADGGAGIDTAQFNFASTAASVVLNADGSVTITETNGDVNTFIEFENFKFTDGTKSLSELFAPTVTLERDGDDIINSDRTTVGYTINLPVGAVVGATLLLVIEGNETSRVLTQEDINAGSITGSIQTSAINGNELSISAEIRYPNQPDNLGFKDNDSLNVNTLPDANNDIISTDEGHAVTIDVLANDTDAENETLSISSASVIEGKGMVSIVDEKLYFEPVDDDFSGKVKIEYVVTDPQKGTSTAFVEVTVNPVADQPDLSLVAPDVTLPSQVFDVFKWNNVVIAPKYGDGNGVSGSELIDVIANLDKENATPSTMANAQDSASNATAANEAVLLTGLVYLEADVSYDFVGKGDDSLAITIGGQLVDEGRWGTGATLNGEAFVPTESGYYPISIYHHNQNGQGNFDVNVSINGAAAVDLSSSNLSIVSDLDSLTSSGIRTSGAQVDANGVEFYDIYQVNEGRQDTAIPLSEIKASLNDKDGSETLSIALTGIPNGATISDGTNSVTITDNQSVDVTSWSLNSLVVTPPAGSHDDFTIKVTATSTEKANNHLAESTVDIHVIVHEQSPTVTQSDFVSGNEDQRISGNVLTNDSDADDVLSVLSISVNGQEYSAGNAIELTEGKLTIDANGSFTFEPTEHWSGNVPDIQYTTNTGETDTLTIEVKAVADAPNVTAVFGDTVTSNITISDALLQKIITAGSGTTFTESESKELGLTINGVFVANETYRSATGDGNSNLIVGSNSLAGDELIGDSLTSSGFGNDVFVGKQGDDYFVGGTGSIDESVKDTVVYSGSLAEYEITHVGDQTSKLDWIIFDQLHRDTPQDGSTGDRLYQIERLIFADAIVELNKDGTYTVIQEKETEFNLSATLADRDGSEYLDEVQIKGLPDGATIVDKDTGELLGGFQVINGEQVWVIDVEGNSTKNINYDNLVVRYPSTETLDVDVTVVAKESSLPSSDAGASTSVNVAASNDVLADQGGEVPTTLISLVIDSSGSMADKPSNTLGDMRIEYVLRAAVDMLENVQSQNGSEDVLVQLVDFDTNAKSYGWITISEAVDKIEDALDGLDKKHYDGIFEPSGWTDYDDAAEATMDGYESNTIKSLQGSTNDVIYFLSDGQNTENWTNSTNTDWDKFIVDKEVIAVGIGDENRVPLDGLKEIAGADGTIVYIPDSKLLTELPKLRPTIGIAGSLLMAISGADEAKEVVVDATKAYVIQTIDTESTVTNMPANLAFSVDDVGNELVVETQYGDFRIGQDGSYFFQPVVGAPVIESGKSVAFEVLITVKDENNIESEQLVTLNVSPNGEANIAATSSFNASTGDDQIRGTDNNDIILGHAGNDVLDGGLGDDVLYGGSGNDILIGGLGSDILTGGEGADIFKWVDMETVSDRVTDFNVEQGDKLDFSDLFEDMTQDDVSALLSSLVDGSGEGGVYKVDVTDVNGDAHLTIVKGGQTLTIDFDGVSAADITSSLMDNLNHLKD
ncbi:Ig-like domain-containing protein [Vibrio navarrensis]|uniref:Ig-like domain-containing protein n=1 Tax=Vibrio navarrensis TaxID=29495 RepID=UPI000A5C903C|nr:cadherin-like domain-containing protein [Vibrio navarrensis]